ncbi:MAG: hypothetical protein CM15mP36_14940 [Flavobacteriales bacterium]|nr:MAG: hypothetical protein CM15mP36_14940 [Flavobacteriales bacterium]
MYFLGLDVGSSSVKKKLLGESESGKNVLSGDMNQKKK